MIIFKLISVEIKKKKNLGLGCPNFILGVKTKKIEKLNTIFVFWPDQ